MKFISILGPPGSGKGTLCKKIQQDYNCKYLSAGDLLRKTNNPEILRIVNSGNLVPSETIVELIKNRLDENIYEFVLLDGFPRSIDNLEHFENCIGSIDVFINLFAREDAICERLLKRKDDRNDDVLDIIKNRIRVYQEQTERVLENINNIVHIDANGDEEKVYIEFKKIMQ